MIGTITVGKIELNGSRLCVVVAGEDIPVTLSEYRILHCLMTNKGETQTYDQITDAYRGEASPVRPKNLTMYISRINQKIGFRFIESVRGVGYLVREEATFLSGERSEWPK